MCNDRRGPKRGVTASPPICSVLPGTAQRQTPIGAQAARLRKIKPQLGRFCRNKPARVSSPCGFDDRIKAMMIQALRKVLKRMHYPLEVMLVWFGFPSICHV